MTKPVHLDIAGRSLPLAVRRSGTARRMSLRLDPAGRLVVVLPVGVPLAEAERFARGQTEWIASRLSKLGEGITFAPGTVVPLLGVDHVVRHSPEARRGVWAEAGEINVSGRPEHLARRLEEFLKAEARLVLAHRSRHFAQAADRPLGRVTVRDTKSRWGSCSASGDLSFSWRLVMAPDWVLDYVVAHEVAHLAEMNHSPRFWRLVETLVGDPAPAKAWLKRHGPDLHRVGAPP